jgi:hypothetical protein
MGLSETETSALQESLTLTDAISRTYEIFLLYDARLGGVK